MYSITAGLQVNLVLLRNTRGAKETGITSFRCDHLGATYFVAVRFLHDRFGANSVSLTVHLFRVRALGWC